MSSSLFLCICFAAAVAALPNVDSEVPETDLFTNQYEGARSHVTALLESGKTSDECKKLSDASIKSIKESVSASQTMLDALPTGKSCAGLEQALVDKSKATLDKANAAKTAADKADATAKVAPVKFSDINIAEVKANDCSAFHADPAYVSAKSAATAAAKKKAETDAAQKVAKTAYDNAVASQKAAVEKCACDAVKKQKEGWDAASKAYASADDEWKKSNLMVCVLAGTAMSSCNVPAKPTLTKPTLQLGTAKCSTAATPAPTPTPQLLIRVHTGTKKYADSSMKPSVVVTGTGGTYSGSISVGNKGKSKTTTFKPGKDIGKPTKIEVKAGNTNGWLVTKVEVQTSSDGQWRKLGCKDFWLDGKPYDSSYTAPHGDKVTFDGKGC